MNKIKTSCVCKGTGSYYFYTTATNAVCWGCQGRGYRLVTQAQLDSETLMHASFAAANETKQASQARIDSYRPALSSVNTLEQARAFFAKNRSDRFAVIALADRIEALADKCDTINARAVYLCALSKISKWARDHKIFSGLCLEA